MSNESGRSELYVQSFPTPGERFQVSPAGINGWPDPWSTEGAETRFVGNDNWYTAVPVATTPTFSSGRPERLFRVPAGTNWIHSRDGRRIYASLATATPNHFNVVLDWPALLPPD